MFHLSDRVTCGNNITLKSFIYEFKFLQQIGIKTDTPIFKGKFYFELGLIFGENLEYLILLKALLM